MALDLSTNDPVTKPTGLMLYGLKNIRSGETRCCLEMPEDLIFTKDEDGERSLGPAFTKYGTIDVKYGEDYTLVPFDDTNEVVLKNLQDALKTLELPCKYHETLNQRHNAIIESALAIFGKIKVFVIRDIEALAKHIKWVSRVPLENRYEPEYAVNYRLSKMTDVFEKINAIKNEDDAEE